ncbi:VCBS domain-containing protein, partial [Shewanella colwelliana]|uniref:VCBS domain-containing protein n=1 Tax=Shewanella colwelliana TaxID=23 RepID=UPI001C7CC4AB
TDEHGQTAQQVITVTVNGSNDTPFITSDANAATGSVEESGFDAQNNPVTATLTATGTITAGDHDLGDSLTMAVDTTEGTYG